VGVQRGRFAMRTLSQWVVCETYKLVDLWGVDPNYKEPGRDSNAVKNEHMMAAKELLKKWTDKGVTEFFPMRSDDAAKKFPDNYFDFAYIDARHDYCAVLEDIRLYYSKLRPGGIIAGHDFVDAQYALERLGPEEDWSLCEDGTKNERASRGAVEDFALEHNLKIYATDEGFPTWIMQKPY